MWASIVIEFGHLDAGKVLAQAVRDNQRAAPSRVGVIPKSMLSGDGGAGCQRVDHAGAGRSSGSGNHHRDEALCPILLDGLSQCIRIHSSFAIGGDEPDGVASYSGFMRDLDPSKVAFARDVERGRPFKSASAVGCKAAIGTSESADQRGEIRFRTPACEMTAGISRKACLLSEKADNMSFDIDCDGRCFRAC